MTDWMIAIFLLILANVILVIARTRTRGLIRFSLSFIAFAMLFPAFLFAFRALI